jgi:hypothetical protein
MAPAGKCGCEESWKAATLAVSGQVLQAFKTPVFSGHCVSGQSCLGGPPGDGLAPSRERNREERLHASRPEGAPHREDCKAHVLRRRDMVRRTSCKGGEMALVVGSES